MKQALVFSALGKGSGCYLRAAQVAEGLRLNGYDCRLHQPFLGNLPFSIDAILSVPWFGLLALFSRADFALGIKPYPNCVLALWILKLKGCRVVCDIDDLDWGWRAGLASRLARLAQLPAFFLLDQFSTHHPGIPKRLAAEGLAAGASWLPLDQGVDLDLFRPGPKAREPYLLFTAHLNVACQLDVLMDLLFPLLAQDGCPRLVVAGGGPLLAEFRARHQGPKVSFSGAQTHSETAALTASARVCLAAYAPGPGNEFRVPMKVLEYLAAGRPVVSNLIAGLQPWKRYIYASDDSAESWRRMLKKALGKGDGREKRGRAALLKTQSWKAVCSRFLTALG